MIGFGYPFSSVLLFLYGGSQLATSIAVTLLRVYCVYVLFLGLNGISEAFFMVRAVDFSFHRRPQRKLRDSSATISK